MIAGGTPPGGILSGAGLGRAPGDEDRCGPTLEHGFITCPCVVGPISRDLLDRIGNLFEERGQRLAVVHSTLADLYRKDLFGRLINSQVQLAPRTPAADTVLPYVPFSSAAYLETGRIDHHMPWAAARSYRELHR